MELPLASWSAVLLLLCLAACAGGDPTCSSPATPKNGEMFVLWPGLLVQYRCFNGFKLIGPSAVICRNGTWTQDAPLCKTITENGSLKIAMQGDEAGSRHEDQAQLQGASKPLLTVIAVPEEAEVGPNRRVSSGSETEATRPDTKKNKKKNNAAAPAVAGAEKNGSKKKNSNKKKEKESKSGGSNNNGKAKERKNKNNPKPEQEKPDKKKGRRAKASGASGNGTADADERNINQVETDATDTSIDGIPVDFASLDQSCLFETNNDNPIVAAPSIPHSAGVKYARRRNKSSPNNRYAVAVYQCSTGFSFSIPDADRLYCRQGRWIGPSPICLSDALSNAVPEAATSNNNSSSRIPAGFFREEEPFRKSAIPEVLQSRCAELVLQVLFGCVYVTL